MNSNNKMDSVRKWVNVIYSYVKNDIQQNKNLST